MTKAAHRVMSDEAADILIVDDKPENLDVLVRILRARSYRVRPATSGPAALQSAMARTPDLVLLDVNMPGIDGYEVCRRLKADERLRDVPVVFISALSEPLDKLKAFRVGGVDYISKPFNIDEVEARVVTQLRLRMAQRDLVRANEKLEEKVRERTAELSEAHARLEMLDQAKRDFLRLISHELRTPIHGILGIASLVFDRNSLSSETVELREDFLQAERRLLKIVDDALMLAELDVSHMSSRLQPVDVCLAYAAGVPEERPRDDLFHLEERWIVQADARLLGRGIREMVDVAYNLSEHPEIRITVEPVQQTGAGTEKAGWARMVLKLPGVRLSERAVERFFEVFAMDETETPGVSLGLGPALADRIFRLHGGHIDVRQDGDTLTTVLALPARHS